MAAAMQQAQEMAGIVPLQVLPFHKETEGGFKVVLYSLCNLDGTGSRGGGAIWASAGGNPGAAWYCWC